MINFYDELSTSVMVKDRQHRYYEEARVASITRRIRGERTTLQRVRQAVGLQIVHLGQRISGLSAREIAPRKSAGPSLT